MSTVRTLHQQLADAQRRFVAMRNIAITLRDEIHRLTDPISARAITEDRDAVIRECGDSALAHDERVRAAERERCAQIAIAHKGAAERRRRQLGAHLHNYNDEAVTEIQAEERGEDIAAEMIAATIRAGGKE